MMQSIQGKIIMAMKEAKTTTAQTEIPEGLLTQAQDLVKDTFRNTKEGFSDLVMEVACGLHNLRVTCRHPLPSLNLLDLCT
jgi:hypothetical protein